MPIEVTENYIRIRQKDPGRFQKDSFRTIWLSKKKGIAAVIGKLKGEDTTTIQTYLFDKKKWTKEEAIKWVKEHGGVVDAGEIDEIAALEFEEMVPLEMEVFKAGVYPQGTYTEKDLDEIAGNYNPEIHEAPIVIGHPVDNKPAYGWVEKLYRKGKVLIAKVKVLPEFVELIKKGLYKKRSISLYENFMNTGKKYLRHIGFLGAQPPAVKGLADIKLSDEESFITIDFEEVNMANNDVKTFTEEQVKALIQAEVEKTKRELIKQFEEQQKKIKEIEEEKKKALEEKKKLELELKKTEIKNFIEKLKQEGKIIPAMEKLGLEEFMLNLEAGVQNFSEQKSMLTWFKEFLEAMPKLVDFSEKGKDGKKTTEFSEDWKKLGLTPEDVEKFGNLKSISF